MEQRSAKKRESEKQPLRDGRQEEKMLQNNSLQNWQIIAISVLLTLCIIMAVFLIILHDKQIVIIIGDKSDFETKQTTIQPEEQEIKNTRLKSGYFLSLKVPYNNFNTKWDKPK